MHTSNVLDDCGRLLLAKRSKKCDQIRPFLVIRLLLKLQERYFLAKQSDRTGETPPIWHFEFTCMIPNEFGIVVRHWNIGQFWSHHLMTPKQCVSTTFDNYDFEHVYIHQLHFLLLFYTHVTAIDMLSIRLFVGLEGYHCFSVSFNTLSAKMVPQFKI